MPSGPEGQTFVLEQAAEPLPSGDSVLDSGGSAVGDHGRSLLPPSSPSTVPDSESWPERTRSDGAEPPGPAVRREWDWGSVLVALGRGSNSGSYRGSLAD